jgi:hypothetical protein
LVGHGVVLVFIQAEDVIEVFLSAVSYAELLYFIIVAPSSS